MRQVFCVHSEPNFSLPWQRKRQYSSTSSGFITADKRILTNAHSVDHHTQVSPLPCFSCHTVILVALVFLPFLSKAEVRLDALHKVHANRQDSKHDKVVGGGQMCPFQMTYFESIQSTELPVCSLLSEVSSLLRAFGLWRVYIAHVVCRSR